MPYVHAWRQRRLINRQGEQVEWHRALKADDYNPATNFVDRRSRIRNIREFGHVYYPQSLPSPLTPPVLTPLGYGHIPAGTYAYAYAFRTRFGETLVGPAVVITLPGVNNGVQLSELSGPNLQTDLIPESLVLESIAIYRARCNMAGTIMTDFKEVGEVARGDMAPDNFVDVMDNAKWRAAELAPLNNTTYPFVLLQDFRTQMEMVGSDGVPSIMKVGNARIATMPDECPLTRPDKIVLNERLDSERMVIQRGSTQGGQSLDLLPNAPIVGVHCTIELAAGGYDYQEGTDYEISANRRAIEWLGDAGPAIGSQYSVEYSFRPTMWFLNEENVLSRQSRAAGEEGTMLATRSGRVIVKHPDHFNSASQ